MEQLPTIITRASFEAWVASIFNDLKTPSLRKIAKIANISKSRLSYQLTADSVDPRIVISVARELELSPLVELSKFPGYESLGGKVAEAKPSEVLAFISHRDIYAEIGRRLRLDIKPKDLDVLPPAEIWYSWFKIVAPSATQSEIKEITGASVSMISRNHQAASWDIGQILIIAKSLGISPQMSLAASGNLTLSEAGFSPMLREQALKAATDLELQARLEKIASSLASDIGSRNESELAHAIVEHLA
ncbi:hypothetical protein AB0O14_18980 [Microbacterium foliorum]|uniref:hypothetical protein n=1 Tax=Rothia terrae TaxID=396015 RepID=UPI00341F014A